MQEGNDGMTKKADTGTQDLDNATIEELDASAEAMLREGEEDDLDALADNKDGDGDGSEEDAESTSSAEDSQSDDSKAKESPNGDQSNEILKQLMEQNKLLVQQLGQRSSSTGNSTEEQETDTGLPDTFEIDEVPEGFAGLEDYLKDMGSKQLGFIKQVVAHNQKLEDRLFKLEGSIEIEFIKRDLKVSREEEQKIFDWSKEQGFAYSDPTKAENVIKTYRKLQGLEDESKKNEKGNRSKRNANGASPGNRTKTTDKSEGRGRAEVEGSSVQREEAEIMRKTLADMRQESVAS